MGRVGGDVSCLWETPTVPFPDEQFAQGVEVVPHRPEWATEGAQLTASLTQMLPEARAYAERTRRVVALA